MMKYRIGRKLFSDRFLRLELLLLSGLLAPAALQAATIQFNDETTGGYGFSAKAGGFKKNALGDFVKVGHRSFQLKNVTKSGHDLPTSTNVSLQNVDNQHHPNVHAYPSGSIGWSYDGGGLVNPTYTFTLSAGGKLDDKDKGEQCYELSFTIDGGKKYSIVTNPNTNWDPKLFHKVPFHGTSTMVITLRTRNPCTQHGSKHDFEPMSFE